MKHSNVKPIPLPHFKGVKNRKRFFSPQEEGPVIEYLTQRGQGRYGDLFIFLNDTGLRPWAEALPLTWKRQPGKRPPGWVDLSGKMLRDIPGKNGEVRDVPLTRRALVVLDRCPRDQVGPWTDISYHKAMTFGAV